jgi:pantothenate kinase
MSPTNITFAALVELMSIERSRRPRTLVGVVGPPGAGKSTVAAALSRQLAAPIVPMDGFHLAHELLQARGATAVKGAPHTFDADGFVHLVERVHRADGTVFAPRFDRRIENSVAGAIEITESDTLVIVEGNYLLLDEQPWMRLRTLLHVVVYLDLDDEERRHRLIDRHMSFGRSRADAEHFVDGSDEVNAALVVSSRGNAPLAMNVDDLVE